MSTVGYGTLDVIPSVKGLRAQLEQQTSRDFAAAGRRGGEQFGDAAGKSAAGRFKAKFGSVGKDVFAPIAGLFAGAVVVGVFKDAISGASDLAESGNKVKVIFGDATSQVEAFAAKGAKELGQTRLAVLNAASSFGVFGKAAGLSGGDLADFSTKLAGLSTDLASFFNTDPSQATEAIAAGLRGESEPLRQFGVLLDDATLRQEALRQGLISTTKQALTPQQRVLAAYQVILKQTSDAQGDFQRTSGGLANQQRILSAQWSEMKTELGSKLLPAATQTVKVFNDGVLPTMEKTGGVAADAVRAFASLPAPIKAATGALVAFKLAQATGVTSGISTGFSTVKSGLETVRLRAMLAKDEFHRLSQGQLEVIGNSGKFTPAVGRMTASLGALRLGAAGAGTGLKRGLSGASALVGGPWGAAFIAGTAIVAHFWAEHQKAKQRVEDFTATLDKETGAITQNTRETAAKQLADSGVLAAAERLGLSLETVTSAALGQKDSYASLTAQMRAKGQLDGQAAEDAIKVKGAIDGTNSTLQQAISNQRLFTAAMGSSSSASSLSVSATGRLTGAVSDYTTAIDKARAAVQKLLDKENERRNKNLSAFQDQTRLAQALADARKEAADGKKTLDASTEAGRKNRDALAALADGWNSAADKVKNAKGAYHDIRQNFIDVAEQMGASEGQAKRLADRLLGLPKNKAVNVTTPGMEKALEDLRKLKRRLAELRDLALHVNLGNVGNRRNAQDANRFATGGMIGGAGTGTSDSNLIWASRGEFMQRKAAVDYYGVDFMARLNNLQVPKYASGGPIGTTTTSSAGSSVVGHEILGLLRWEDDGLVGLRAVIRDEIAANDGRRVSQRRHAGMGGSR